MKYYLSFNETLNVFNIYQQSDYQLTGFQVVGSSEDLQELKNFVMVCRISFNITFQYGVEFIPYSYIKRCFDERYDKLSISQDSKSIEPPQKREIFLHDIDISVRLYNVLKSCDVHNLATIDTPQKLKYFDRVHGYGIKSKRELTKLLKKYDILK